MTDDAKIIGIETAKKIRMLRELRNTSKLPIAYLCTKYGSDTFIEALMADEVKLDDYALVSLTDRKKDQ